MTTAQNPSAVAVKKKDMAAVIEDMKPQFTAALSGSIPVEYFMRVALTTFRKNPLIQQCTPQSVMASLLDIAQLRLSPDSILGEAYLVPFFNGKPEVRAYEAVTIIGYKGLVKMVRRNNNVLNITAEVVYKNEKFVYRLGSNRCLQHEPMIQGDPGPPIGAYAYIAYKEGGEDFLFVNADYIERIRKSSKGSDKDSSPWNMWWEGMWKKTAVRQLAKIADISPEVGEAIAKDWSEGAIDVESTVATTPILAKPSALAEPPPATPAAAPEPPPAEPPPQAAQPPAQPAPTPPAPRPQRRRATQSDTATADEAAAQQAATPPPSSPTPAAQPQADDGNLFG